MIFDFFRPPPLVGMDLSQVYFWRYTLPLREALQFVSHSIIHRKGWVVCLVDREGNRGYGEIASTKQIFHASSMAGSSVTEEESMESLFPLCRRVMCEKRSFPREMLSRPALLFGLYTAYCDLMAQKRGVEGIWKLFVERPSTHLSLTPLLHGSSKKKVQYACKIASHGECSSIKLKVGSRGRELQEEIKLVYRLRDILGDDIDLICDSNRSWSFQEAVTFGSAVQKARISYLEEPTSFPEEFSHFYQETGIPFALDETLIEERKRSDERVDLSALRRRFPEGSGLKTLVIKPTFLTYCDSSLFFDDDEEREKKNILHAYSTWSREEQLGIYISSSYETSLGLMMLAELAVMNDCMESVGIDTARIFSQDLMEKSPFSSDHTDRCSLSLSQVSLSHVSQKLTPWINTWYPVQECSLS